MRIHAVLCMALLASACSVVNDPDRHTGGGPGGPEPISAADLCGELTGAVCHARTDCCPEPGGPTLDECRDAIFLQCTNAWGALAIDPRTGYDPDEAGRVLARGWDLATSCETEYFDWVAFETFDMFTGTIPGGGSCAIPSEDELATIFQCTDGNLCRNQGVVDFQCAPRSGPRGDCRNNFECRSDLYCEITGDLRMGQCQRRKPDGAACDPTADECQSLACNGTCIGRFDQFFCFDIFEDV